MVAGQLEILLLANMARLQADMDKAKRTVSSTVDAMNKVLGTIGVGVSLAGITSMIKSVVDVGDHLNDLRKITGLTVNELGGLDKQAKLNGTNLDSVAKAIGIMSKNMYTGVDAFKLLGIATKDADGNLRNANQVLLDVADRFSRMQDGAQKSAIANQIFGKSGRELIPLLNEGRGALESAAEAHRKYSGVTQASAEASDLFNDNLTLLSGRVTAIKTSFVGELLPTLNAISTAMLNSGQSTNQFSFAANVVVPVLKGLAIAGAAVAGIFQGVGREIGAAAAQMAAIARFDFNGVAVISKALAEDHKKADAAFDKYVKTILNSDNAVQQANVSQQKMIDLQVQIPNVTDKAAKAIERKTKAYDIEIYKLKQYEDLYKKGRDLTERVATSQERYNNELRELEALRPYITVETYNRALEKAQKELKGTEVQTRQTTDEVSQLWMQAGRNIQSSLANGIFNFFDDGLKGMLKNVISTVGRIASEFAALRIAQSVGLAGMFGSGAASAGGIGGTGSILSGAANLGSSALNLFKVGGGISQGVSGLLGIGSTGTQAAAEAGATALWGASGASAGIGSSIASFAGPAIAVAAVDQIVRMLAGDKMIGGTAGKILNYVPVIGPLINGLFGHGPMKQQGTLLEGQIGAGGFESGMLQTRFKAKGGLFRSDKIDYSRVDAVTGATFTDNGKLAGFTAELAEAGKQIFDSINEATKQTSIALRGVAGNLGLATGGMDDFNYSLKILTEKGEMIQGEQIAEEIAKISEGLANSLMPGVKEFQKSGETAVNTLVRLSGEFSVLSGAAGLLFDKSAQWSKDLISQFSIGVRSAFLEQGGGAETFAANAAGFAKNFYSEEQLMKPFIAELVAERDKQNLSGLNTRQQVADAMLSGDLNPEQVLFLVNNQQEISEAFTYLEKLNGTIEETAKAAEEAAKNVFTMGGALQIYNNAVQQSASTIDSMVNSVDDLKNIAKSLGDTVNTINPMTSDQARSQVMYGGANSPSLQAALSVLSNSSTAGFNNVLDFNRAKSGGVSAINGVRNTLDSQINKDERRIAELTAAYAMSNSSMYESLRNVAKFETGGTVPRTGLAVLHKDEKVLTANESDDMANQIRELNVAVATLTIANNKMTRILDKWDGQGMPAERVA